jgi:hypothetical protein
MNKDERAEQAFAEFRRDIDGKVRRYGRAVMGVFPDRKSRAEDPNEYFVYTIGNHHSKLPELLLIGFAQEARLLNILSQRMMQLGAPFNDGEMVGLGAVPLCVLQARDEVKDRYTIQATGYYGHRDYGVMQVVVPDKAGHFPWQPECARPYNLIRVYRKLQA